MIRILVLSLVFGQTTAFAGDLHIGLMLEPGVDLPDPAAAEHTAFGLIPALSVPFEISLTDRVDLRLNPRLSFASGRDRLNWEVPIDGERVQFYSVDQRAFMAASSFTVGPVVKVPLEESLHLYFGAAVGLSWVGTYHSLKETSQVLFDLDDNDLANPGNIDPFTSQLTVGTDLCSGVVLALDEQLSLKFELGYAAAYVGEKELIKSPSDLNATRSAYGWNPIRAGVGLQFSL